MRISGNVGRLVPRQGWHRCLSNQECPPKRWKPGRGRDEDRPIAARKALWRKFLEDPSQWWDHRCSKRNVKGPDFVHSATREGLWIDGWSNPAWVKDKVAALREARAAGVTRASYRGGLAPAADCEVDSAVRLATGGALSSEAWSKLCDNGQLEEAFGVLDLMHQRGVSVPSDMFQRLLSECVGKKNFGLGRRLHALAVRSGQESNTFVGNHIIRMYAAQGSLLEASQVFSRLSAPDEFGWASIISAYAEHGQAEKAVQFYMQMRESSVKPNNYVYVAALKACTSADDVTSGKVVHADAMDSGFESNQFVGNALVNMYSKFGKLDDARSLFDRLPTKNVVTWTSMILGYAQHGLGQEGLRLYVRMQEEGVMPNKLTYLSTLKACGSIGAIQEGEKIHGRILKEGLEADVFIGNSLMAMYADCGNLDMARRVFETLPTRNVVTWTTIIGGYVQRGLGVEALELYSRMQQDGITPDSITLGSILRACGSAGAILEGKSVHAQIVKRGLDRDVVVATTLINMYIDCGCLGEAEKVFEGLAAKNVVAWTAMIAGYMRHGAAQEALKLFHRMQQEGVTPDTVTLVTILRVCGSIGALQGGKRVHALVLKRGLHTDLHVGSSLMNMYTECGSLEDALDVFDRLPNRNVVTWTAMINCYGQHNKGRLAVQCFEEMLRQGVEPDATTYVCLLTACSHVALVKEGQHYFQMMETEHGITPSIDHYNCMVDLLGRSGCVDEAEKLLQTMPMKPDGVGWMSLLTACQTYRNVDQGKRCFDRLIQLDPQRGAAYVLMSSIYSDAGMSVEADEIERLRRSAGAQKQPATALIEVNDKVHKFIVGESSFSWREPSSTSPTELSHRAELHSKLRSLSVRMKEEGHVPHTYLVRKPISNREKEDALCGHAEKLAIAFGLLNTPEGSSLLVIKDLRMCNDCHSGSKVISKMERREIIVRDAHRVHHFKAGSCSCGDFP